MFSLTWKIQGDIKMSQHPTTTHTSYICNALGLLLYLLVSAHGVTGQFCRPCSTVRPAKLESSLSCAPD